MSGLRFIFRIFSHVYTLLKCCALRINSLKKEKRKKEMKHNWCQFMCPRGHHVPLSCVSQQIELKSGWSGVWCIEKSAPFFFSFVHSNWVGYYIQYFVWICDRYPDVLMNIFARGCGEPASVEIKNGVRSIGEEMRTEWRVSTCKFLSAV